MGKIRNKKRKGKNLETDLNRVIIRPELYTAMRGSDWNHPPQGYVTTGNFKRGCSPKANGFLRITKGIIF